LCHNESAMLRIRLFGPPLVFDDDQPLTIKRRGTRALLFYLAAQGKPVTRDHLADSFWPDLSIDQARRTLRDNLGKIRTDLPDKSILQTGPDVVSLDFSKVWVDFLELQTLFGKIIPAMQKLPEDTPVPIKLYNQMAEAVQLWNGQPFIANGELSISDELTLWMERVQVPLNEMLRRTLRRLAKHDEILGNVSKVLEWLWLIRVFDEYDDEINRKIIEAYLHNNMLAEAQEFYEAVRSLYEVELNIGMPEGILALESRIYSPPAQSSQEAAQWAVHPSVQVPFIGQNEVLEQLSLAYRTGGGILVFGEAGAGKTRLAQEFVRRQESALHLFVAACQPLETGMPFAPWINLLRSSVLPEHWQRLDPMWASPLTLLVPDLTKIRPDISNYFVEHADVPRSILLEAIHQLLLSIADNGPLVLFIDDVHWADESTLAIVSYLLHKSFFRAGRGLLIMAARLEETNALLDKILLTTYPQPLRHAELRHLNRNEIVEISNYVLERGAPETFIDRVQQESGGNPFFLLQLLQSLQDIGVDLEKVKYLPITQSVHELIERRLQMLSVQGRELLSIAAVLGSQFELAVLEGAIPLPGEQVVDALEELEKARLIKELGIEPLSYGFVHEKIREGLLAEMNPSRKRLLNQRAATALETRLARNYAPYAARLAQHHENAGNYAQAFDYWVVAGQYAWRLASTYDSIEAYKHAERLIPRTTGLSNEQLYQLYRNWNQVAFEIDDAVLLEDLNRGLSTLGHDRNSDLLIGLALEGLSDAAMASNRFAEAFKYVQEAYPYIEHSENIYELIQAQMRHGTYLYMLGKIGEAQSWLQKVTDLTENTDDPLLIGLRGVNHYHIGLTETMRGYTSRGIEHAKLSAKTIARARSTYGEVEAYSVEGLAYSLSSACQLGLESCLKGLALADRMAGWRMYGYLASFAAMNETDLGLIGDAWDHAQKAIEMGQKQGHGEIVCLGYRSIGDIYLRLGNLEQAARAYEQGAMAAGEHFVRLENVYRLGYVRFEQGQETALKSIQESVDLAFRFDAGSVGMGGMPFLLAALLKKGEQAEFDKRAAWFCEQVLERFGSDNGNYTVERICAETAFRHADYETAHRTAEPLILWYAQTHMPWYEVSCLHIKRVSGQHLGRAAAGEQERMLELLDQMQNSIKDAPFKDDFASYREGLLAR
jgi:DNA-binding SARP family transcriptional activator/tetratricopeptide (TPR) repeat protein